jgi:hypothetical protein
LPRNIDPERGYIHGEEEKKNIALWEYSIVGHKAMADFCFENEVCSRITA